MFFIEGRYDLISTTVIARTEMFLKSSSLLFGLVSIRYATDTCKFMESSRVPEALRQSHDLAMLRIYYGLNSKTPELHKNVLTLSMPQSGSIDSVFYKMFLFNKTEMSLSQLDSRFLNEVIYKMLYIK
jgi:hypothetical protein